MSGGACVILPDRTAMCWGGNSALMILHGDAESCETSLACASPRALPGITNIEQLVVGETHGCVITDDGAPRCWGDNSVGQLGTDGVPQTAIEPIPVQGLP